MTPKTWNMREFLVKMPNPSLTSTIIRRAKLRSPDECSRVEGFEANAHVRLHAIAE